MSFGKLVAAALAIGLASAALTIGAAAVAGAVQADHDVTGTIAPSANDDRYVDMFASGPGRGWFAPHRAAPLPRVDAKRGLEP
jgi:hypothetical protein